MAFYSKVDYWNSRYAATAGDHPVDWYRNYNDLCQLFHTKCLLQGSKQNCRVLILGCGNSTLGEDLWRDGWASGSRLVNLDFSDVVVSQMKNKYDSGFYERSGAFATSKSMEFICADMTHSLPFEDGAFDLVICKASFDAILSGQRESVPGLVSEVHRLLAPGNGVFLLVSNGNPDNRLEHLEYNNNIRHYWQEVTIHKLKKKETAVFGASKPSSEDRKVYAYICRKHGDSHLSKENTVNARNSPKGKLS